jgi:hypothetical protein
MNMQPWYEISEARHLISSCAARLPKKERHVQHYPLTCDEWTTYTGRRVARLHTIRNAHLDAALAQADRMTDRGAASRWMASAGLMVGIEDAIDAAVQAKAIVRKAA